MKRVLKEANNLNSANSRRVAQRKMSRDAAQGDIASRIDNSPLMVAQRKKLQSLFGGAAQLQEESAHKPNRTGLPDNLKSGIENLSGMSMDNVKVHYNSSRPAQINALAYAQGSDIHVAPGQEHHLAHEAWHVVQQAQGRVLPTMQMQDGVAVNNDKGLEREADVMGAKAVQMTGRTESETLGMGCGNLSGRIIQRHGPGYQNSQYSEGEGVHLGKHLDVWQRFFPEVDSVDKVRKIAIELFNRTDQDQWENKGGNYYVDHRYGGQTVRLAWGDGGIVSCYIWEPRVYPKKKKRSGGGTQEQQSLQHGGQYTQGQGNVQHNGYYWTPDFSSWWDAQTRMWRERFEPNGEYYFDWYYLKQCYWDGQKWCWF